MSVEKLWQSNSEPSSSPQWSFSRNTGPLPGTANPYTPPSVGLNNVHDYPNMYIIVMLLKFHK